MEDVAVAVIAAAEEHARACLLADQIPCCKVLLNVHPDRRPDVGPRRGSCSHPAWHDTIRWSPAAS